MNGISIYLQLTGDQNKVKCYWKCLNGWIEITVRCFRMPLWDPKDTLVPCCFQTQFHLCHYVVSHDHTQFARADEFMPERWLRADRVTPGPFRHHPYSFIPFGVGVRGCVGKRVAEMEMYFALCGVSATMFVSYHATRILKCKELSQECQLVVDSWCSTSRSGQAETTAPPSRPKRGRCSFLQSPSTFVSCKEPEEVKPKTLHLEQKTKVVIQSRQRQQ